MIARLLARSRSYKHSNGKGNVKETPRAQNLIKKSNNFVPTEFDMRQKKDKIVYETNLF